LPPPKEKRAQTGRSIQARKYEHTIIPQVFKSIGRINNSIVSLDNGDINKKIQDEINEVKHTY
jgi:hypothetical protein